MDPQQLDYISIGGFKSIAAVERVPLRPLNLLIGSNGSGKSNFIGVFEFLHAIREGRLQQYVREVGGADQLLHFGSKTSKEIRFHISFGEEVNQYNIQLRPSQDDSLFVSQETVSYWKKEQYGSPLERQLRPQQNGLEAGISDPNVQKIASWVRHRLSLWRVFHVHDTSVTSPMRKTAKLNDNAFLRPDGSNLPAFLYRLQAKFPSSYSVIRATIQRVAPFFDDFLLRPDPLNEEAIRLEWKHKNSDQ